MIIIIIICNNECNKKMPRRNYWFEMLHNWMVHGFCIYYIYIYCYFICTCCNVFFSGRVIFHALFFCVQLSDRLVYNSKIGNIFQHIFILWRSIEVVVEKRDEKNTDQCRQVCHKINDTPKKNRIRTRGEYIFFAQFALF